MADAPGIEAQGLVRTFKGDILAVDGIDLRVEPGEVFGFLGPNGAGKSTPIRLLVDLIRPTAGGRPLLALDTPAACSSPCSARPRGAARSSGSTSVHAASRRVGVSATSRATCACTTGSRVAS